MSKYNLRRRGIHQSEHSSDSDSNTQNKGAKSRSETSSCCLSEPCKYTDTDSETDAPADTSTKKPNKGNRLYPQLPKEDLEDQKKRRDKLRRQNYEEKTSKLKEHSSNSGMKNYLIIILVTFAVLAISFHFVYPKNYAAGCESPACLFQHQYKTLQDVFSNQDRLSWKIIRVAVNSVVNSTEHAQPAVILLVASKDAEIISSCIAKQLASLLASSYKSSLGYPRIDNTKARSTTKMKEIIDTTFKESFEEDNHHVILLEKLNSFSAESAMMLHSFCDHENAPYKDIVIIITMIIDDVPLKKELRPRDMDRLAREHLDKLWKTDLSEEKRAALLSRITTSVVVVHPEKTLPSICDE